MKFKDDVAFLNGYKFRVYGMQLNEEFCVLISDYVKHLCGFSFGKNNISYTYSDSMVPCLWFISGTFWAKHFPDGKHYFLTFCCEEDRVKNTQTKIKINQIFEELDLDFVL